MQGDQIDATAKSWARAFARKFYLARHIVDELAQEAAIGILIARKKYDARHGPDAFKAYARAGAVMRMKRHMNKLAGPVAPRLDVDPRIPKSVGLTSPDAPDNQPGHRDTRSTVPEYDNAIEFEKAVARQETRVQTMIHKKLQGCTHEEIAIELGISRECVRKKVVGFFAMLDT